MELVREGWEPLWYDTLLFLHPAGWVPGTTLRDLKGITKGLGMVKWLRGCGCRLCSSGWLNQAAEVLEEHEDNGSVPWSGWVGTHTPSQEGIGVCRLETRDLGVVGNQETGCG